MSLLYISGYVTGTPDSLFAVVNFKFQKKERVRTRMIIPMGGAIATPELRVSE